MLENFGTGWKNAFEKRLDTIRNIFPEVRIKSINRYFGMLRLDFIAPSDDIQYVVDCVAYRIERESAKKCEMCGKNGVRRTGDLRLPEAKCLCINCYAVELDKYLTENKNN